MNLDAITGLLRKRIGLDPESLGPSVVPSAVALRQRALGIAELSDYAGRLQNSAQEFEALVNELVVCETWFFRGGELFSYLAARIKDAARNRSLTRPFRVLCVPCCTGEEPYSLSIALTELQVPRKAWHIDACDINERFLARARKGHYTDFSFRQTEPDLRERYFHSVDGGWELDESIRSTVDFHCANLVEPGFLHGAARYDLIFCRNLFIYLHDAARQQVIGVLDRLLASDGLIAMGHAEPLSSLDRRFRHVGPDGCFLYAREGVSAADSPAKPALAPLPAANYATREAVATKSPASRQDAGRRAKAAVSPRPAAKRTTPTVPTEIAGDPLTTARQHADAGRLDEAWADCQALLTKSGPTADLFTLLGIIQQARHDKGAKQYFEKALYLDPDHGDSLLHLMLLCEQQGAHSQAAALRSRLERATQGGDA
ncbi:MAG TPA: CheR family methyltransferase [Pirellulales bacterium]|jgi:chemotaxis protein methyltransferase WspC